MIGAGGPVAAQSPEIVIGQTLSLTGASSTIATELQRGRHACIDLVNAQGGVRGHRLRLATRDDRGDPAVALKAAAELAAQERAVMMLGSMGPAVNATMLDWAAKEGIAVVAPYGGDVEVRTAASEVAFFLSANQSEEAANLTKHVASLGIQRVAVVYAESREGRAALTALEEGLTVAGLRVMDIVAVRADGSDAGLVGQAIARTHAQALLLATSSHATVAVLRALSGDAATGAPRLLQVYGLSSSASAVELKELGSRAVGLTMSQVMPSPRDTRLPVVQSFLTATKGLAGERTYAELEGCTAVLLVADVLRRRPAGLWSRGEMLTALRSAGRINLGGFEVNLGGRGASGSNFTDIVFVGPDGRIQR